MATELLALRELIEELRGFVRSIAKGDVKKKLLQAVDQLHSCYNTDTVIKCMPRVLRDWHWRTVQKYLREVHDGLVANGIIAPITLQTSMNHYLDSNHRPEKA